MAKDNKAFFQSLIDVPKWDKAKWRATAFLVATDEAEPPWLGVVYQDGLIGKKIFSDLISRVGSVDKYEELKVTIVDVDASYKSPGYFVQIGSDPEHTAVRAIDEGKVLDFDLAFIVSRINRMNPAPNSPHLGNFKKSYAVHGKYVLIPVSVSASKAMTPHFELGILKKELWLKSTKDLTPEERKLFRDD